MGCAAQQHTFATGSDLMRRHGKPEYRVDAAKARKRQSVWYAVSSFRAFKTVRGA